MGGPEPPPLLSEQTNPSGQSDSYCQVYKAPENFSTEANFESQAADTDTSNPDRTPIPCSNQMNEVESGNEIAEIEPHHLKFWQVWPFSNRGSFEDDFYLSLSNRSVE